MIPKLRSVRERWQRQNAMPCRVERRESFCLDAKLQAGSNVYYTFALLLFSSRKKVSASFLSVNSQNACTKKLRDTLGCTEFIDKYTFSVDPNYFPIR